MTMSFSFHDNFDLTETGAPFETTSSTVSYTSVADEKIPFFVEKMRVPDFESQIARPRLQLLLEKSFEQFGAALITGRTGTGKTALAAEFSKNYERADWLRIDAADADWKVFSRYFSAAFPEFDDDFFAKLSNQDPTPSLIVLDDVHNIFDAGWFGEFFVRLLYSLTPEKHLLMLSRAKPSEPLWRLRSKQVLSVIDEKVLAFTPDETKKLFKRHGISAEYAARAQKKCFGRIGKLLNLLETKSFDSRW